MEYAYSGAGIGHKDYIRAVIGLPNNLFASGSRDGSIRIWMFESVEGVPQYTCINALQGHHRVVGGISSLQFIPAGVFGDDHPELKDGALVSGAYDKRILIWGRDAWMGITSEPTIELASHTKEVVSLAITAEGDIVSGSADCTVKLWKPRTKVYSPVRDFYGHKAPVWGVAALDNGDIASGSGDRTIKIWDVSTGDSKYTVQDHEDCVRGLANFSGVGIVVCSNDFSVRLYTYDGVMIHMFVGHENFVFSTKILQNGCFGTASDDGTIKIWRDFQVAQSLQHPIGLWDLAQLDNGDIIVACQDGLVRVWTQDPERMAPLEIVEDFNNLIVANMQKAAEAKKKPPKQMVDGVYFDFAFPIEFDDGTPPLKLGYNLGDNAYTTAEEFIAKYKLNYGLKETIAKHILSQTKDYQLDEDQPVDPIQQTTTKKQAPVSQFFPLTKIISNDKSINMQGVMTKIKEFNAILEKNEEKKELALLPHELGLLQEITAKLSQNRQMVSFDSDTDYILAFKLLAWPGEYLFPVLDLIRCWVLMIEAARFFVKPATFFARKETGVNTLICLPVGVTGVLIQDVIAKGINQPGHKANKKLSLWILGNIFSSQDSKTLGYESEFLAVLKEFYKSDDSSVVEALTSIAVNLSIQYYSCTEEKGADHFLAFILEWLSESKDETQQLRLLIAVANLVIKSCKYLDLARNSLKPLLEKFSNSTNNKIKLVSTDLKKIVQ